MIKNKIVIGDCVEVMKSLPPECVDLVITSPPYFHPEAGVMRDYLGKKQQQVYDFDAVAAGLIKILKPGGVLVWMERNSMRNFDKYPSVEKNIIRFRELGLKYWQNLTAANVNPTPGYVGSQVVSRQDCPVFAKGKPDLEKCNFLYKKSSSAGRKRIIYKAKYDDVGSLGTTIRENQAGKETREFRKATDYIRLTDDYYIKCEERDPLLITFAGGQHQHWDERQKVHSAAMPWRVAQLFVHMFSQPGDLVFDPFAGSGTTLAMAKLAGRKFLGAEIHPDYANVADEIIPRSPLFGEENFLITLDELMGVK